MPHQTARPIMGHVCVTHTHTHTHTHMHVRLIKLCRSFWVREAILQSYGVEVTELSTKKQQYLSKSLQFLSFDDLAGLSGSQSAW